MKTLLLMRHGKSSWDDRSLPDHDRPLNDRGRRDVPAMAGRMAAEGLLPDVVLCSTAARTRETWSSMEDALGEGAEVCFEADLYGASPRTILDIVGRVTDDVGTVLVIGHNPGTEELAAELVGDGDEGALDAMARKFPTAALAVLDADVAGWSELRPGACRLRAFVRPKDL